MSPYQAQNRLQRRLTDIENDLYTYLFYVSVPEQGSRNISDIKRFGVHTSGLEEYDQGLDQRWINVYIPVAKIADYINNGVPVKLSSKTEKQKLYELANEYCVHWANMLSNHLNIGDAPIDDLILYDKLAGLAYEIIKFDTNGILSIPKDVQRLAGFNLMKTGLSAMNNNLKTDPSAQERPSMADIFKRHSSIIRGG